MAPHIPNPAINAYKRSAKAIITASIITGFLVLLYEPKANNEA